MNWLTMDSSAFILNIIDHHWLILGFTWGTFKLIAKRTKTTLDDELVSVIAELKERKKTHE